MSAPAELKPQQTQSNRAFQCSKHDQQRTALALLRSVSMRRIRRAYSIIANGSVVSRATAAYWLLVSGFTPDVPATRRFGAHCATGCVDHCPFVRYDVNSTI